MVFNEIKFSTTIKGEYGLTTQKNVFQGVQKVLHHHIRKNSLTSITWIRYYQRQTIFTFYGSTFIAFRFFDGHDGFTWMNMIFIKSLVHDEHELQVRCRVEKYHLTYSTRNTIKWNRSGCEQTHERWSVPFCVVEMARKQHLEFINNERVIIFRFGSQEYLKYRRRIIRMQ